MKQRTLIYEHFKEISRTELKKVLDFLDKEGGGIDKFDLISADHKNDLFGLIEFIKNEYGLVIPNSVLLSEKDAMKKEDLERLKADKEEEELIIKKQTEELKSIYEDITEITNSPSFRLAKLQIEASCLTNVGTIIIGKQGMGKSTLFRFLLDKLQKNYAVQSTTTTYVDLIDFLFQNREKDLIVLEDVSGIWENERIISLLRQAVGNCNEEKIIHKGTPDYRLREVPSAFPFKPNIVIVCNEIKNMENPQVLALLDRCAKPIAIYLSNQELKLMFKVITEKSKSLTDLDKTTLIDFIEKHSDEATDMSLRTIHKIMEYYTKDKENWEALSLHELAVNPTKRLIIDIQKRGYVSVQDEVKAFKEEARKLCLPSSRSTFFNMVREMKPIAVEV